MTGHTRLLSKLLLAYLRPASKIYARRRKVYPSLDVKQNLTDASEHSCSVKTKTFAFRSQRKAKWRAGLVFCSDGRSRSRSAVTHRDDPLGFVYLSSQPLSSCDTMMPHLCHFSQPGVSGLFFPPSSFENTHAETRQTHACAHARTQTLTLSDLSLRSLQPCPERIKGLDRGSWKVTGAGPSARRKCLEQQMQWRFSEPLFPLGVISRSSLSR